LSLPYSCDRDSLIESPEKPLTSLQANRNKNITISKNSESEGQLLKEGSLHHTNVY
jgi:hypothetical protein